MHSFMKYVAISFETLKINQPKSENISKHLLYKILHNIIKWQERNKEV